MTQNYRMTQEDITEQKHPSYVYAKSYIGQFLVAVPMFPVLLAAGFWGNSSFLWLGPFFAGIGWFILFSLNYHIIRPSKKRIALHLFYAALIAVALQCSVLVQLNTGRSPSPLENPISKVPDQIPVSLDLTEKGSHLMIEETELSPSGESVTEGNL